MLQERFDLLKTQDKHLKLKWLRVIRGLILIISVNPPMTSLIIDFGIFNYIFSPRSPIPLFIWFSHQHVIKTNFNSTVCLFFALHDIFFPCYVLIYTLSFYIMPHSVFCTCLYTIFSCKHTLKWRPYFFPSIFSENAYLKCQKKSLESSISSAIQ